MVCSAIAPVVACSKLTPQPTGPDTRAAPPQRQVREDPGEPHGQVRGPDQGPEGQGGAQVAHLPHLGWYVNSLLSKPAPRFRSLIAVRNRIVILGFIIFGGLIFEAFEHFFGK